MKPGWEAVIGLEIHAQLSTESKIFCGCSTRFGDEPNANTCPVCLGLPGSLPVLNWRAVELGARAALSLGLQINGRSIFARKGRALPTTEDAADYAPGDVITWELSGGLTHIGILTDRPTSTPGRYLILHNIGSGPQLEDVLFAWKITGHYRYTGPPPPTPTPTPARRARR